MFGRFSHPKRSNRQTGFGEVPYRIDKNDLFAGNKNVAVKKALSLSPKANSMIRTFYTPDSNLVALPIPDQYVGTELEIIIFPLKEPVDKMPSSTKTPVFGCAKGQFVMADDFDAPLDDFKEYME